MGAKMLVLIMAVISICFIPMIYANTLGTASYLIPATSTGDDGLLECDPTTYKSSAPYYTKVSSDLWNNGQACGRTYSLICDPSSNPFCTTNTLQVVVVGGYLNTGCPTFILSNEVFAFIAIAPATIVYVDYTLLYLS